MYKMKLKKKIKFKSSKNKINFVILVIIFLIISVFLVFKYINTRVSPLLLDYAEIESKKLSSIINRCNYIFNTIKDVFALYGFQQKII